MVRYQQTRGLSERRLSPAAICIDTWLGSVVTLMTFGTLRYWQR
jgi:hypothetical protein